MKLIITGVIIVVVCALATVLAIANHDVTIAGSIYGMSVGYATGYGAHHMLDGQNSQSQPVPALHNGGHSNQ